MNLKALGLLSLVAAVNAQYFSAGWSPGQPTTHEARPPAATFTPEQQKAETENAKSSLTPSSIFSLLDLNKLLSTGPSVDIFSRFGINITEKLEVAIQESKIWDDRIPMITDHNYKDLVENEALSEKEERDRTWIIVITVSTAKEDTVSKLLDRVFDTAYNASVVAGDLPDVRWGRIDYFNVTTVTTKWTVWNAPYLVLLKNRGQTLRFYRPQNLRMNADALRKFLEYEEWVATPPWTSQYGPGGSREYIVDYLALVLTKIYKVTIILPRWMFYLLSGGFASALIGVLHRNPQQASKSLKAAAKTEKASNEPAAGPQAQSSAAALPQAAKRKKAKGRHAS